MHVKHMTGDVSYFVAQAAPTALVLLTPTQ
jgi:hypothetical protein